MQFDLGRCQVPIYHLNLPWPRQTAVDNGQRAVPEMEDVNIQKLARNITLHTYVKILSD